MPIKFKKLREAATVTIILAFTNTGMLSQATAQTKTLPLQ